MINLGGADKKEAQTTTLIPGHERKNYFLFYSFFRGICLPRNDRLSGSIISYLKGSPGRYIDRKFPGAESRRLKNCSRSWRCVAYRWINHNSATGRRALSPRHFDAQSRPLYRLGLNRSPRSVDKLSSDNANRICVHSLIRTIRFRDARKKCYRARKVIE